MKTRIPPQRWVFSHNSLREFLVADAFADYLSNSNEFAKLSTITVTDAVVTFFADLAVYSDNLLDKLSDAYMNCVDSNMKERLFRLLFGFVRRDAKTNMSFLGNPPILNDLDLSGVDFSGLPLRNANLSGSILPDTDFRNTNLQRAQFDRSILDGTMLDAADIESADFSHSEIESIFVYDEFDTKTTAMLHGKEARQWLFSRGGKVRNSSELNPLLGKPWYEAAREVTKTLERRIAGSHQDSSLSKGTSLKYRQFAIDFVKHLRSCGVLVDLRVSRDRSSTLVKVDPDRRNIIRQFNDDGTIDNALQSFFDKYL